MGSAQWWNKPLKSCADELWWRINFDSSVDIPDLTLSGEMRQAVEMENLQPKEAEIRQQQHVNECYCVIVVHYGAFKVSEQSLAVEFGMRHCTT